MKSFENLISIFGQNSSKFWLAIDQESNAVIGSIAIEFKSGDETMTGELRRMCVSKKHRRKGVATALVQHLLRYAKAFISPPASTELALALPHVFLSTPTVNTPGIELYTSIGFVHDKIVTVATTFGDLELTFLLFYL